MDRKKKSYNLLIGIAALVAIVAAVAMVGYIVSEPDPIVLQGQAEAAEYRVSGKVPGRVEKFYAGEGEKFRAVWKSFMPAKAISYTRVTLS